MKLWTHWLDCFPLLCRPPFSWPCQLAHCQGPSLHYVHWCVQPLTPGSILTVTRHQLQLTNFTVTTYSVCGMPIKLNQFCKKVSARTLQFLELLCKLVPLLKEFERTSCIALVGDSMAASVRWWCCTSWSMLVAHLPVSLRCLTICWCHCDSSPSAFVAKTPHHLPVSPRPLTICLCHQDPLPSACVTKTPYHLPVSLRLLTICLCHQDPLPSACVTKTPYYLPVSLRLLTICLCHQDPLPSACVTKTPYHLHVSSRLLTICLCHQDSLPSACTCH